MAASEKSHNAQVERIMTDKVTTWEKKVGRPGVEICYRKGKLVVRRCDAPSTVVELNTPGEADQ